jgi:peptide/nickel transport system permease protein
MLVADFILVLPGAYVILVLRGLLPLVLGAPEVFALMTALFAASAWPHVARGVRAIVATERTREYAEAARASGAGTFGLLRHLVPAARGFVLVEIVLLVPALLVAEATVSYFGIGFPEPTASWGTMLQEAGNVTMMAEAPWLLASALAIFVVVFALHIAGGTRTEHALFTSSRS